MQNMTNSMTRGIYLTMTIVQAVLHAQGLALWSLTSATRDRSPAMTCEIVCGHHTPVSLPHSTTTEKSVIHVVFQAEYLPIYHYFTITTLLHHLFYHFFFCFFLSVFLLLLWGRACLRVCVHGRACVWFALIAKPFWTSAKAIVL